MHQFKVDDYGAPPYPELALRVSRQTLDEDAQPGGGHRPRPAPGLRGDDQRPGVGGRGARRRAHVDRAATARELDAVSPAFTEGVTRYGELDPKALAAWARWEARFGITKRPPDVARAFAPGF